MSIENIPHIPSVDHKVDTQHELAPLPLEIETFLANPDMLSAADKIASKNKAERYARGQGVDNKVGLEVGGKHFFGKEYPSLFCFNGELRGKFDNWVEDNNERSTKYPEQAIGGPGGDLTHVFFETDDGHMYVIRRSADTLEEKSAAKQEFEVISTSAHMGKAAEGEEGIKVRRISSEQLKDVFVRPGEPLVLGEDPDTGKQLKTRGAVTRITGMKKRSGEEIHPNLKYAKDEAYQRDTPGRFMEAVEKAQRMDAAATLGPLAIEGHLPKVETVQGAEESEEDNSRILEQEERKYRQEMAFAGADILDQRRISPEQAQKEANDFTTKVTERIREVHTFAKAESRDLTEEEKTLVSGLRQTIQGQKDILSVFLARRNS